MKMHIYIQACAHPQRHDVLVAEAGLPGMLCHALTCEAVQCLFTTQACNLAELGYKRQHTCTQRAMRDEIGVYSQGHVLRADGV